MGWITMSRQWRWDEESGLETSLTKIAKVERAADLRQDQFDDRQSQPAAWSSLARPADESPSDLTQFFLRNAGPSIADAKRDTSVALPGADLDRATRR